MVWAWLVVLAAAKLTAADTAISPLLMKLTLPPTELLVMEPVVTLMPPVLPAVPTVEVIFNASAAVVNVLATPAFNALTVMPPVTLTPLPVAFELFEVMLTTGPVVVPAKVTA